jgi:hypothetical protein
MENALQTTNLDVRLSCACGQVLLRVYAKSPVHLVCYCDDCQGYVEWLTARRPDEYGPETAVDAQGGSRTFQVFGSEVQVVSGGNLLVPTALDPRLVPKGRPRQMLRAHCSCCFTPMFSASWRELATVGIYAANVVISSNDGSTNQYFAPDSITGCWGEDSYLGSPAYRINTKWAKEILGVPSPAGSAGFPLGFLLRFIARNIFFRNRRLPFPIALPKQGDEEVRMEMRS